MPPPMAPSGCADARSTNSLPHKAPRQLQTPKQSALRDYPPSSWALHFIFHLKAFSVFLSEHLVRLRISHKPLGPGVHLERDPERGRCFGEVHFVRGKMLLHPAQHFCEISIPLDGI